MKKKTFVINTLILTATSIVMRSAGISFRVFISNKIGAEGMGLYQLIFSIYMLFVTIATSGISMAVTRLVTENEALGFNAKPVVKKSVAFSLFLSLLSGFLLFFFADFTGTHLLKDARTVPSLKVLAFGLPFLAVSACLRGYFFAMRKAVKTAGLQLFEMSVEICFVLCIMQYFFYKGLTYACLALVIASTVAEVAACLLAYFLYQFEKKKMTSAKNPKGIIKSIFKISLPIAASSYIRSIFSTAENVMIPINLEKSGMSKENALSQLGMIKAMTIPVLFFPALFLNVFSSLLIPEIAESDALNHKKHVTYAVSRVFRITLVFSMLASGIFFFFSKDLSVMIYKNSEIGYYIRILAPLIPFMYLDDLVDAMLKGLNQQMSLLKINICDSIIRILLIIFAIPKFGISGMIIVLIVSNIFNPFFSIYKLVRVARVPLQFYDWIAKPVFCVCCACILVISFYHFVPIAYHLIMAIFLVILLYCLFLWLFRCVTREDIIWFKSFFTLSLPKSRI